MTDNGIEPIDDDWLLRVHQYVAGMEVTVKQRRTPGATFQRWRTLPACSPPVSGRRPGSCCRDGPPSPGRRREHTHLLDYPMHRSQLAPESGGIARPVKNQLPHRQTTDPFEHDAGPAVNVDEIPNFWHSNPARTYRLGKPRLQDRPTPSALQVEAPSPRSRCHTRTPWTFALQR